MNSSLYVIFITVFLVILGCVSTEKVVDQDEELYYLGKRQYIASCTYCHGPKSSDKFIKRPKRWKKSERLLKVLKSSKHSELARIVSLDSLDVQSISLYISSETPSNVIN